MTSIKITQNDTVPLTMQLEWDDGTDIDLTAASSVKFMMTLWGETTPTVDATCAIVTADEGIVRYTWDTAETATVGLYSVQWEITYSDATILTVPTSGKRYLLISGELG